MDGLFSLNSELQENLAHAKLDEKHIAAAL